MSETLIRDQYMTWRKRGTESHRKELFRSIWEHYHPRLQVYLSRFFYSESGDREDFVSEILLHVFESIDSYNCRYAFSTWIYRVARNRCIDTLRREGVRRRETGTVEPEDGETPESVVMRQEERMLVREAVERLSDSDRELVFLHFYEELKYKEISSVTGMPVGTVKYRMSEIRKVMKKDLSRSLV